MVDARDRRSAGCEEGETAMTRRDMGFFMCGYFLAVAVVYLSLMLTA